MRGLGFQVGKTVPPAAVRAAAGLICLGLFAREPDLARRRFRGFTTAADLVWVSRESLFFYVQGTVLRDHAIKARGDVVRVRVYQLEAVRLPACAADRFPMQ